MGASCVVACLDYGELPLSGLPSQIILLLSVVPSLRPSLFCHLHLRTLSFFASSRHK